MDNNEEKIKEDIKLFCIITAVVAGGFFFSILFMKMG